MSNGNGRFDLRQQPSLWPIVSAIGAGLVTWFTLSQFLLMPIRAEITALQQQESADIAALQKRLDDALQQASLWRESLRAALAADIKAVTDRAEERRTNMQDRMLEIYKSNNAALADLAVRVDRMENVRSEAIADARVTLTNIENRLQRLEEMLEPMRGPGAGPSIRGGLNQ